MTAWFFFLMFVAFFGGIANFQNYINNVFLWFLRAWSSRCPSRPGENGRPPSSAAEVSV